MTTSLAHVHRSPCVEVTIGCLKEKIREMEDRREEDMAVMRPKQVDCHT